ncbi:hypothetical protein [Thermoactinospora rubra]|uniref:hypothetical protein n=1 Tax=Thermoactinospora rubra TaxID=1088767 RepID=UPI000A0FBCD6|nr:hypothetical protein [Thermoactinospora rubra]
MSADKAARQRFALIVGEGVVRAVAQVTGFSVHDDRIALEGEPLAAGHPVRDAYLGALDPVTNGSQNPVGYCDLPEEAAYLMRPCHCGCAQNTDRDFLPGHDVRAMQARVRAHFDGSPLKFIQWVDANLALTPPTAADSAAAPQLRS